MYFQHSGSIWEQFSGDASRGAVRDRHEHRRSADLEPYFATAAARLDGKMESDLPEIQAWRRTFSKMGLKPTQYRCAAESLLRRYRKDGELPSIHPIIDLCNAVSLSFALPIAVFDLEHIDGGIEVGTRRVMSDSIRSVAMSSIPKRARSCSSTTGTQLTPAGGVIARAGVRPSDPAPPIS
ncbi:MAG: phenylalanine--tRNA ligase beta subunit-related protein [Thermomicrobiales bacterium]